MRRKEHDELVLGFTRKSNTSTVLLLGDAEERFQQLQEAVNVWLVFRIP